MYMYCKWNAHTGPSLAAGPAHMPCSGSQVVFYISLIKLIKLIRRILSLAMRARQQRAKDQGGCDRYRGMFSSAVTPTLQPRKCTCIASGTLARVLRSLPGLRTFRAQDPRLFFYIFVTEVKTVVYDKPCGMGVHP